MLKRLVSEHYQMPSPINVMLRASHPKRPIAMIVSNVTEEFLLGLAVEPALTFIGLLRWARSAKCEFAVSQAKSVPLAAGSSWEKRPDRETPEGIEVKLKSR